MDELKAKRIFKVSSRSSFANSRFTDKITGHDVYLMLVKYDYKCFYCNESIKNGKWQLDHFHPKANGGLNHPDNIVPCCRWCNTMKNALDGNAFIKKCEKIVQLNYFKVMGLPDTISDNDDAGLNRKRVRRIVKYISELNDDKLTSEISNILEMCAYPEKR